MSTVNSTCTPVLPPGVINVIDSPIKAGSQIAFTNPRPTTPLPPLVQANLDATGQFINVCAIVFIDSSIPSPVSFTVYQNSITGVDGAPNQIQFYICYDYAESTAINFNAYTINFASLPADVKGGISVKGMNAIETFSWDSDPVTSRGTVTTVQPN
jgi:hypothetical protein